MYIILILTGVFALWSALQAHNVKKKGINKLVNNLKESQYNETLNELVEYLDVKDKINIQVRRLSLGERMKMEIIAALLHRPKIILLDEPTLGLDVISQSKIREFVKYYNDQYKATFIITSHYMNDIDSMCKRVFVMNKGKGLYGYIRK